MAEPRGLVRVARHPVGDLLERAVALAGTILHHHLEAAARANPADRRRRDDQDVSGGDPRKGAAQLVGHMIGVDPLGFVLQRDEHRPGVRRIGEGRAVEACEGRGVARGRVLQCDLLEPAHDLGGALQGRAGRHLHDPDQIALVLLRDETGGRRGEAPAGQADEHHIDDRHDAERADRPRGVDAVAFGEPLENAVEGEREPTWRTAPAQGGRAFRGLRLQHERRHGRRQGQRHERRDRRGADDAERELLVELSGDPRDEDGRQEDADQHQGDRDQRAGDLVHGLVGRLAR